MISAKMAKALNTQINKEMYSSYLYLAFAAKANELNLKGSSRWFQMQAKEEMEHAMKLYGYIEEQQASVTLAAIDAPKVDGDSLPALFKATLAHEKVVTSSIHKLVALAREEKDYATEILLQWFVSEQVEEEANAAEIVAQLKMIGDHRGSLFMLDARLGQRAAG